MARHFNVNNFRAAGDTAAQVWFAAKNIALLAGWEVIGSGDGGTRHAFQGLTAPLPVGEQGEGGQWDCWQTANARATVTHIAGDCGSTNAWVLLQQGSRQWMFQAGTAGITARIIYNPGGGATPEFVGPGATSTLPGAASREFAAAGSRAAFATIVASATPSGYFHAWADDQPEAAGATSFGVILIRADSNIINSMFGVAAMRDGTEFPGDLDGCFLYIATTGPSAGSIAPGNAYNPILDAGQVIIATQPAVPLAGNGNTVDGIDPIQGAPIAMTATAGSRYYKGYTAPGAFYINNTNRAWGHWGVDQSGRGWCQVSAGMVIPWPDAATVPLP